MNSPCWRHHGRQPLVELGGLRSRQRAPRIRIGRTEHRTTCRARPRTRPRTPPAPAQRPAAPRRRRRRRTSTPPGRPAAAAPGSRRRRRCCSVQPSSSRTAWRCAAQTCSGSDASAPGAGRQGADEARAAEGERALSLQAPDLLGHPLAQLRLGDLRRLGGGFELGHQGHGRRRHRDDLARGWRRRMGVRTHLRPSDGPTRI